MKQIIHIEICRSRFNDKFNIRIGDLRGATECLNCFKESILKEISDEIDGLEGKNEF